VSTNKHTNPAYISHVHLKGYKSIIDTEVELHPGLNILIGPNGSGKTNFLEFLYKIITIKFDKLPKVCEGQLNFFFKDINELNIYKFKKIIGAKNQHIDEKFEQDLKFFDRIGAERPNTMLMKKGELILIESC